MQGIRNKRSNAKWDDKAFEFGLRPKDQFKVMQRFDFNTESFRGIESTVYTANWNTSSGFISFYDSIG